MQHQSQQSKLFTTSSPLYSFVLIVGIKVTRTTNQCYSSLTCETLLKLSLPLLSFPKQTSSVFRLFQSKGISKCWSKTYAVMTISRHCYRGSQVTVLPAKLFMVQNYLHPLSVPRVIVLIHYFSCQERIRQDQGGSGFERENDLFSNKATSLVPHCPAMKDKSIMKI